MQRWIDLIDWRRRKDNRTIEWLCEGICDIKSYNNWQNGTNPDHPTQVKISEKLGGKMLFMDRDMTTTIKPVEWALLSLFCDARESDIYSIYYKTTGHNIRPDRLFYTACKLSLFTTFYYRSEGALPENWILDDNFVTEYSIQFLRETAVEYGMLGMNFTPTQLMYKFYVNVTDHVDDFLLNANIRFQINE